jgi:hypothetical protein
MHAALILIARTIDSPTTTGAARWVTVMPPLSPAAVVYPFGVTWFARVAAKRGGRRRQQPVNDVGPLQCVKPRGPVPPVKGDEPLHRVTGPIPCFKTPVLFCEALLRVGSKHDRAFPEVVARGVRVGVVLVVPVPSEWINRHVVSIPYHEVKMRVLLGACIA